MSTILGSSPYTGGSLVGSYKKDGLKSMRFALELALSVVAVVLLITVWFPTEGGVVTTKVAAVVLASLVVVMNLMDLWTNREGSPMAVL